MAKRDEITFGDLISVQGYEGRLFFVDGWQDITVYEPDATYDELIYEITCAFSGECAIAYGDEVTRVCGAEQADDYLMFHATPPTMGVNLFAEWFDHQMKEAEEMFFGFYGGNNNQPNKPTARQLSSQEAERRKKARKERKEKIDALLDEYNDLNLLVEMFDDEEYKAKAEYVALKLAELAAEGDR